MKPAQLGVFALLMLPALSGAAVTLYEDPTTGQVFTRPGPGRVQIDQFPGTQAPAGTEPAAPPPVSAPTAPPVQITAKDSGEPLNDITILDPKSPEFLLGRETQINMKFVPQDSPDMYFKAGIRMQGTLENAQADFKDPGVPDTNLNDAYLRRARLEIGAGFGEHTSFTMDIRNDRVNFGLRDEGEFTIGDAYVDIKKPFDTSLVNFKLYRAKIDVARTQTIKSAYMVDYDRTFVSDAAANFISFNRRAANLQMYGDWKKKIHYQLAFGDATQDSALKDAVGAANVRVTDQSLFYGGKILFSPFDGWEEVKKTETYMGQGKHFSVGAAYWTVPTIEGEVTDTGAVLDLKRELINVEASAHYKGFLVQYEYFKFKDTVEDFGAPVLNVGDSEGWYVLSEYVMPNFYYIAPFVRYEDWDVFEGVDGYDVESFSGGVNWYLRGNTTKVGLVYQDDSFGENIGSKGARDNKIIRITSQFFF